MRTRRRLHNLVVRVRRCLVVGMMLAGYALAAVGFPLPAAVKDVSRPYPCQGHACGCLNAEQCWRSCCCYSAEEKVAWARQHQVEAPAEVVAEAERGWRSPRLRDQQKTAAKACCCCCSHDKAPESPARSAAAPPTKKTNWIDGVSARHCRGLGTDWLSGAVAPPPSPHFTWMFDWSVAGRLLPPDDVVHSLPSAPPAPPPRGSI
jgi:hypothetical protein